MGLVTALALATVAFSYLALGQVGPRPTHLTLSEGLALATIVGIVAIPGTVFALLAAHRHDSARAALLLAAVLISAGLGAGFMVTALTVWCAFTGDCL